MAKVIKKDTPVKAKLSPEERHWNTAEEKSKELIDQLLNSNLPIEYKPQNLNLENSTDWRVIAREDVPRLYEEDEELPNAEYLAEQIAYHYVLTLLKGMLDDLSNFACHDSAWFEKLLNHYENY